MHTTTINHEFALGEEVRLPGGDEFRQLRGQVISVGIGHGDGQPVAYTVRHLNQMGNYVNTTFIGDEMRHLDKADQPTWKVEPKQIGYASQDEKPAKPRARKKK